MPHWSTVTQQWALRHNSVALRHFSGALWHHIGALWHHSGALSEDSGAQWQHSGILRHHSGALWHYSSSSSLPKVHWLMACSLVDAQPVISLGSCATIKWQSSVRKLGLWRCSFEGDTGIEVPSLSLFPYYPETRRFWDSLFENSLILHRSQSNITTWSGMKSL